MRRGVHARALFITATMAIGSVTVGSVVTASGDDPVTLTIGVSQDVDSPNVTVGVTVSAFEVWNLMYATLTDKAAADFETIPGLAESWDISDDGLTITYHLREGLTWTDGEPLTAEDVAYTINRSRDEEWLNHSMVTGNLDAVAVDDRTVEITSTQPDPRLPVLDVYIVPKHIYEEISADELVSYAALDGVGSGPYTLSEHQPGQAWTMAVNPDFYGWAGNEPPIDRIVYRIFSNDDAKIAALKNGELDAASDISAGFFTQLDGQANIVGVEGLQGGFAELGINSGDGIGDGSPALADINVRKAISHAINREAIFERVYGGLGQVGSTMSVSPDPEWTPELTDDELLAYDLDEANRLLDEAGYTDTNGDGRRETPDGDDFVLRYAQRSESEYEPAVGTLITAMLDSVGIGSTIEVFDDSTLTEVIGAGEYDLFVWGWVPFVDPDTQLSYFTCDQVTTDPALIGWNDANWCNETYDELYEQQRVELDRDARREIIHEMIRLFYNEAPYVVLAQSPDLQAYRTDRFEGWTHQPTETGPVLFTNSSPTYVNLRPIGDADPSPDNGS